MHSKDSSIVPQPQLINDLPEEILSHLFRFLKEKELGKLMTVCKYWHLVLKEILRPSQEFHLNPFSASKVQNKQLEFPLDDNQVPSHTEIFIASPQNTRICFLSSKEITETWINLESTLMGNKFFLINTFNQEEKIQIVYIFNLKTQECLMKLSFLNIQLPITLYLLKNNSFISLCASHRTLNMYNFFSKKIIICSLSDKTIISEKMLSLTDSDNEFSNKIATFYHREGRFEIQSLPISISVSSYFSLPALIEYYNPIQSDNTSFTSSQQNEKNYRIFSLSNGKRIHCKFPLEEKSPKNIIFLNLDFQLEIAYYQYSHDDASTLSFYKNTFSDKNEQIFQTKYRLKPADKFFEVPQYHRLIIASIIGVSEEKKAEINKEALKIDEKYGDLSTGFFAPMSDEDALEQLRIWNQMDRKKLAIQIWDTLTHTRLLCWRQRRIEQVNIEKIFKKGEKLIILTREKTECNAHEWIFFLRHCDLRNPEKNNFDSPKTIAKLSLTCPHETKIDKNFLFLNTTRDDSQDPAIIEVLHLSNGKKIFDHAYPRCNLHTSENNKTVVLAESKFEQENHKVFTTVQYFKRHLWLSDKTLPTISQMMEDNPTADKKRLQSSSN